jgi:predicted DNA-binding protein
MKRTALFLKAKQVTALRALSKATGVPVAELVRRAIDAYLELRKSEIGR